MLKYRFFIFLSILLFSLQLYAQDSAVVRIDSVALRDSLRREKLAHTDTSFFNLTQHFSPKGFAYPRPSLAFQPNIPQQRESRSIIVLLLSCLVTLMAVVKWRYSDYFGELLKAAFSFNTASMYLRDFNSSRSLGSFLMNTVFVVGSGIFIYLVYDHWFHYENDFFLFFYMAGFFAVHYLLRMAALHFLGYMMNKKEMLEVYWYNISVINQLSVLLVIPLLFIMTTGNSNWLPGLAIGIGVIYLSLQVLKYIKGVSIGIQQIGNNFFHFIVYICALEIAPVLIIYKISRLYL